MMSVLGPHSRGLHFSLHCSLSASFCIGYKLSRLIVIIRKEKKTILYVGGGTYPKSPPGLEVVGATPIRGGIAGVDGAIP